MGNERATKSSYVIDFIRSLFYLGGHGHELARCKCLIHMGFERASAIYTYAPSKGCIYKFQVVFYTS